MILCYGEILADMIGTEKEGVTAYERYAGGAPFNVACACKRAGGESGFVGSVGKDLIGGFLADFARAQNLDLTDIAVLPERNTTLAFVQLDASGERSFCFYRKHTADYALCEQSLRFIEQADIVHLGSLMLSEREGIAFADALVEKVKRAGKKLSFDINYRDDIFPSAAAAKEVYARYAAAADIVKYSEDELELFTGKKGADGLRAAAKENKLVCVTLGGKGSAYALGGITGTAESIRVRVADTTGAGDAFYGALLSQLDGKVLADLTGGQLQSMFRFANVAGAIATTARGAINSLPYKAEIEARL
ncbi:MAG: carbohydrate kinase [Clostridiales bacterium]|nr:carbohydrate kinase [Clostridiales bacterium]